MTYSHLTGRERFLVRTSNVLLFCTGVALKVLHWILFTKDSIRGFEKIDLSATFRATDPRIRYESEALRRHLVPHEEAVRPLTPEETADLLARRSIPTDIMAEKESEVVTGPTEGK